jgi:ABC-type Zn uptake system ZnuABC Zn-binding protein ZnuA
LALFLLMAACVPLTTAEETGAELQQQRLQIVTVGTLLANHIYNIAGDHATITQVVPQGTDPHSYEPAPSDVVKLTEADLVIVRGSDKPEAVRARLAAIVGDENKVILLAPLAIDPDEYIYDDFGVIDVHMGGDPIFAVRFAGVIRDALANRDPDNAGVYQANYDEFAERIEELDAAIMAVTASIPEENRQLYSYHNSFAYFARRYGYTILGSVQPHDFAEPSAQDVAAVIELLRERKLPAIFGSSFSPSPILEQISRETGIPIVRIDDDALPGDPGDLEHSFFNMRVQNMKKLAEALGGDPTLVEGIETRNVPDTE